jgi:acyl-CoA synthetase (AMP-forming)/AMP-acid ligase II
MEVWRFKGMDTLLKKIETHEPLNIAFIEASSQKKICFGELSEQIQSTGDFLQNWADRSLVFLYATNSIDSILLYLTCLKLKYPVCLIEPNRQNLQRLVERYHPKLLLLPANVLPPDPCSYSPIPGTGYYIYRAEYELQETATLHLDLALLLQTSGSTGSPKLVRLTEQNLSANAFSISTYLNLDGRERSIQSLPMQYSYGLSLINSHLWVGGTTVLTTHSFMRPEFWQDFNTHQCTSFAGVPYMYETLARLKFDPAQQPTLSTLTQAGGGLRPDLIRRFHRQAIEAGCRFFIMYGQTEATARIAYVPPEQLEDKIGSIGIPIPLGHLGLAPIEPGSPLQELVYRGSNVMMGYAETPTCLALGDELGGILRTGDLAQVDADGFFHLVGRLKRIAKLFGQRINLQDVEQELEKAFPLRVAAVDGGKKLNLFTELLEPGFPDTAVLRSHAAQFLQVPPSVINIELLETLPATASGKKDYQALQK